MKLNNNNNNSSSNSSSNNSSRLSRWRPHIPARRQRLGVVSFHNHLHRHKHRRRRRCSGETVSIHPHRHHQRQPANLHHRATTTTNLRTYRFMFVYSRVSASSRTPWSELKPVATSSSASSAKSHSAHAELSKSEREAKYLFNTTRTQDALSKWTQTQFKDNLQAIDGNAILLVWSISNFLSFFSADPRPAIERYWDQRRNHRVRSTLHWFSNQSERIRSRFHRQTKATSQCRSMSSLFSSKFCHFR